MGAVVRELRPRHLPLQGLKPLVLKSHDRIGVVGKSGSGKSRWTKEQVGAWLRAGFAVVAFDPMDEYSQHGRKSPERSLGPLLDRVTVNELLADPMILARSSSLAVVPEGKRAGEIARQLEDLADVIEATGQLIFVLEEMGLYQKPAAETLENIFCRFRHVGVPVVGVAQRAVMLPASCRAQLSQIVSFSQSRAADLAALAEDFSEDFAAAVSRLKRGDHQHWREED